MQEKYKITPDILKMREIFKRFMRAAILKGFWFIFIDESAVVPSRLSLMSWVHKDDPKRVVIPSSLHRTQLTSAITSTGDSYSVLREGLNNGLTFHNFIVELE